MRGVVRAAKTGALTGTLASNFDGDGDAKRGTRRLLQYAFSAFSACDRFCAVASEDDKATLLAAATTHFFEPMRRAAARAPPLRRRGAFYLTLVPIRRRSRGERRSLRTLPGASLRPHLAFNPRPRRLSTPSDAFQLHPDIAS